MSSYGAGPSRHHSRPSRPFDPSEEGEIRESPAPKRVSPRKSPHKWTNPLDRFGVTSSNGSDDVPYGPPKPSSRKPSLGAGSEGARREDSWSPAKDGLPPRPPTPRIPSPIKKEARATQEQVERIRPGSPRGFGDGRRRSPPRDKERESRDERRREGGERGVGRDYRDDRSYGDGRNGNGNRDDRYRDARGDGGGRYDDFESHWRPDRSGGGSRYEPDRYEPSYDSRRERDQYRNRPYDDRGRYHDDYRDRPRERDWRERDRYDDRRDDSSRRKIRSPSPEEGEVSEPPAVSPPPHHTPSPLQGRTPESSYRPPKIKNRPTMRSKSDITDLRPPTPPIVTPPLDEEAILTPPLDDLPPPPNAPPPPRPPSTTPPPAPPAPDAPSHHDEDGELPPPKHRALAATRSAGILDQQNGEVLPPVPAAPNRNELQPSTRVSTPLGKTSSGSIARTPKTFKMWTASEELDALKTTFAGVTTLDSYEITRKLGEGTFGVVTMAKERATGIMVALKKLITHNPRDGVSVTTTREIKILKSLDHPNVVPIRDMIVHRDRMLDKSERGQVFMVFPYMDHDLCGLLGNHDFRMGQGLAKLLFKQILEGMAYIHACNLIHRDIKTANILVDKRGRVMIADFGLARSRTVEGAMPKHMETEYTNMVVTRWYRAPELLLGDTRYGPAVDMWSLGCVLGEMYNKYPVLAGDSDRDQLSKICAKCGPLSQDTFPGWDTLPGFLDAPSFPWDTTRPETSLFELSKTWGMDRGSADLMMKLLTLNPKKRLTAEEALDHQWFWISPPISTIKDGLITVESSHEMTTRRPEPPPQPMPVRPPPAQLGPRHHSGPPGAYHRGPPPQDFRNSRPPPPHMGAAPPIVPGLAQPGHYPSRPNANPYGGPMQNGTHHGGPSFGHANGAIAYPPRPQDNPYAGPPGMGIPAGLPARPPAAGVPSAPFGLAGAGGLPPMPFGSRAGGGPGPGAYPGRGGGGGGPQGMNLNAGPGREYPAGPAASAMAQKRGPPTGPGMDMNGIPKRPRNEYRNDAIPKGPRDAGGGGDGGLPY